MTAEIFSIGDEILIGQIVDTNSSFIAKELDGIGISVTQISALPDDGGQLTKALDEASMRSDIIILTGGLGPTKDDVTKYTLCSYFSDELVRNDEVLRNVEKLLSKYEDTPLSELNKEQAMVPSHAQVLHNEMGTAPGLWMEKNGRVYVALPGVPYEMKALVEKELIPRLQEKFNRPFIYHKTILTKGFTESKIAEKLAEVEDEIPSFLKLAYLPGLGSVSLRISGKGEDEDKLRAAVEEQAQKIYSVLGDMVSNEQEKDEKIAIQISKLLTQRKQFLSAAESCTGGALAAEFTTHPGASSCFFGGLVTYATKSKIEVLEVPKEIIEKYSVVSAEVAEKMAENAKRMFKTDYALSTTGNAGPTKGDSDAQVGTVYIGLATPKGVISKKFVFGKSRNQVVDQAVNKAFEMILKELTE